MDFIKNIPLNLLKALQSFLKNNGFQYSAAVSFYTLFSLAPVILISMYIAGFFVGTESVMVKVTGFLYQLFGEEGTQAVILLLDTLQTEDQNTMNLILGVGFLIFSATTVFIQIRDAFNRIFGVTIKKEVGFSKFILDRVVAFGMILMLGFAMIISLVLDALLIYLFEFLLYSFETAQLMMIGIAGNVLTHLMIFFSLLMMYYMLPEVKLKSRPLVAGSLITTFLLAMGKFGVGMMIGRSSLNQLSGASTSVIVLMLWIYYSSIILFFGVELIRAFTEYGDEEIRPGKYAQKI